MRKIGFLISMIMIIMMMGAMAEGEQWTCYYCNKQNAGRYCTNCGRPRDEATNAEIESCSRGVHAYT